jgi:predicted kinase
MQTILFLRGLPASGKSTFAKQYCIEFPEFVRINKDVIRELLGNPRFTRAFEDEVLDIERRMGKIILQFGKSLIVDDSNFSKIHYNYWKQIALANNYLFEFKFLDVSLEECILRDRNRKDSVGEEVIIDMYNKYLKPNA